MSEEQRVLTRDEDPLGYGWREAKALASSALVPDVHRNKPENALIAFNLARRIDGDPFQILKELYVISGRPCFSTAFMIACFNQTRRFGPIQYRTFGELDADGHPTAGWGCVAWCRDREFGDVVEGPSITWGDAVAEGWTTKRGSKWKTLPQLMIRYRAAALLIRTTAPEVLVGLHTVEEVRDIVGGAADGRSAKAATKALESAVADARDVTPEAEDCGEEGLADTEALEEATGKEPAVDEGPQGLDPQDEIDAAFLEGD